MNDGYVDFVASDTMTRKRIIDNMKEQKYCLIDEYYAEGEFHLRFREEKVACKSIE